MNNDLENRTRNEPKPTRRNKARDYSMTAMYTSLGALYTSLAVSKDQDMFFVCAGLFFVAGAMSAYTGYISK
jgi:zinc transporter ZupT